MRLRLNEGKSRLRRPKEGLRFLGFVVTPKQIRLAAPAVRRARARGRGLARDYAQGRVGLDEVRSSWRSWCAHLEHGTTQGLIADVSRRQVFVRRSGPAVLGYSR